MELIGGGLTVQDWLCCDDARPPGTEARLRQVRRCNSLMLDALRLIHDKGYFHADIKPENLLLHYPAHKRVDSFELKVCDWECDNWPLTNPACGPALCRLRDNLMLARCVCALYADVRGFVASRQLASRRSFLWYGSRMHYALSHLYTVICLGSKLRINRKIETLVL